METNDKASVSRLLTKKGLIKIAAGKEDLAAQQFRLQTNVSQQMLRRLESVTELKMRKKFTLTPYKCRMVMKIEKSKR